MSPRRIALVGAECTGKSTLVQALADRGYQVVHEYLREWCVREGRTPGQHEQGTIAREQWRRTQALWEAPQLVADTTPLMTALYSLHYFQDTSLLAWALGTHRQFDRTLLCLPDGIPWQADGWLRDGAATREQVHAKLLALLQQEGIAFQLLSGDLASRLDRVVQITTMQSL